MSDKYYDEKTYSPRNKYPRNDGTITILKNIRLTQEEEANWDSKAIHEFLQGNTQSNDSIKINTLKQNLRWLYNFMSEKCEITGQVDPEVIEKLQQIKEVM